jgi:hypothetical protein
LQASTVGRDKSVLRAVAVGVDGFGNGSFPFRSALNQDGQRLYRPLETRSKIFNIFSPADDVGEPITLFERLLQLAVLKL